MDRGPQGSVVLVVPAAASELSVVRVFSAAVGRHLGLSLDGIEDLKLAVAELCAEAIEDASPPEPTITVEIAGLGDAPVLSISSSAGRPFGLHRGGVDHQRRRLLEALLPGLELTNEGAGVRSPVPSIS